MTNEMTAEEAIEVFKSELDWAEQNRYPYISENKVKANKLAIKALEQQSSKDCISREEALLALTGMDLPTDRDKLIALFTERIQNLPPVIPERPKGKWINRPHIYGVTFCSKCNYELRIDDSNYCPNCGSYNGGGEE